MPARLVALLLCLAVSTAIARPVCAAESWIEVRSANFTILSSASERATRTLAWQLEQIRSALGKVWPAAPVDLPRPLLIIAVRDEPGMRALAPKYWEQRGGVRPVSVWVSGPDRHYIAIRADVRGKDDATLNPHTSAYFSYLNLVITSGFARDLPLWFSRGLAGVLSNTIVRDDHVLLGPPIPWHLQRLREDGGRMSLARLVATTRSSPDYTRQDGLLTFDAQAWAFVHFLMFGQNGAHQARLQQYLQLLSASKEPAAAFAEALGRPSDYDDALAVYVSRSLFSYSKSVVEAGVRREGFVVRTVPPAEADARRAAFHAAMGRPVEARALAEAARKVDPTHAGTDLVDALLLESEGKRADAAAAYGRAVERGTTDAYAYYRFAMLSWGDDPDDPTLQLVEKSLARAVELNPRYAAAYAALGEVRGILKQSPEEALQLIGRAVTLEPSNAWHRMAAARTLWRAGSYDQAMGVAKVALTLADSDEERRRAQDLLSSIERARR